MGSKSIHQKDNAAETVDIRKDNDAEAIHQTGNATETKDILEDNGAEAYTKKGKVADEWKVSPDGQEVWRIHRKGRRGMFDIRDAKGCPISSDRLSSSRETVVNFANGEKEVIIDEVDRGNANKDLGKPWTGITKFKVSRPGHEQAERHSVTMETFISEAEVTTFEEAVLRGGLEPASNSSASEILIAEIGSLAEHAVPDTACRKTLIGEYTLQGVEQCLRRRGLRVEWVAEENEFRFGNGGLIRAKWVVKMPLELGSTAVMVHAAVLPEGGARTPLLLSKEVLKWLGCVLDLERDTITFRKLNEEIKMKETAKGHYAIPILGDLAEHHEKSASSALRPTAVDAHTCLLSDLRQSHGQFHAFGQEADGEPGDGPRCTTNGRDLGQNPRWPRRRPISGMDVLDLGKFHQTAPTFAEVYVTDKGYVGWCRAHINVKSAEKMRKFRLYVEMRDQKKRCRLQEEIKKAANKKGPTEEMPRPLMTSMRPSLDQMKTDSGAVTGLQPEMRALMKMRRMLEMYNQQGMTGAAKELTAELEKKEKKIAMAMQKTTAMKRGKASSSSAMEEETRDCVSLPAEQPSMASQTAWSRLVREVLSRDMLISLAWKGYHLGNVQTEGPMAEPGQGVWM